MEIRLNNSLKFIWDPYLPKVTNLLFLKILSMRPITFEKMSWRWGSLEMHRECMHFVQWPNGNWLIRTIRTCSGLGYGQSDGQFKGRPCLQVVRVSTDRALFARCRHLLRCGSSCRMCTSSLCGAHLGEMSRLSTVAALRGLELAICLDNQGCKGPRNKVSKEIQGTDGISKDKKINPGRRLPNQKVGEQLMNELVNRWYFDHAIYPKHV